MRVLLRPWFDLDPVLGAPAWPVGAGQSFGDQAFQAEPADLGEQRSAGSDDSPSSQRNTALFGSGGTANVIDGVVEMSACGRHAGMAS